MLKRMKLTVFSALSAAALAACQTTSSPEPREDYTLDAEAQQQIGTTRMGFDPHHGYQITYLESADKSWLWYPGNAVSLPAGVRWERKSICFRYGQNTYNPVVKKRGGSWSCIPRSFYKHLTVASAPGDVFNLASGVVPYRRGKCDGTKYFGRGDVDADLYQLGCARQ